jgi:hypothetical protein
VCFEHEQDLQLHDDDQVAEEIRRLFERYRSSGRHEAEVMRTLAAEAASTEGRRRRRAGRTSPSYQRVGSESSAS